MQFYPVPLRQMIGLDSIKAVEPIEIDIPEVVAQSCKFEVPDHTATKLRSHGLGPIKDQLHSVDAALQLSESVEQLTALDMDPGLALTFQNVTAYLQSNLPASEYELTQTGMRKVVASSHSEDTKFLWKCSVSENPYHVLWLFSKHMLTAKDVECMTTVYPEIHAEISAALVDYIIDQFKADTAIPRPLRIMLAIFFQSPTIKLEQLAAYQKKPTPAPAPDSSAPNLSQLEK